MFGCMFFEEWLTRIIMSGRPIDVSETPTEKHDIFVSSSIYGILQSLLGLS